MRRLPAYVEADAAGHLTGRAAPPPRLKPASSTGAIEAVLTIIDRALAGIGLVVFSLVGLALVGAAIGLTIFLQGAWLGSVLGIAAYFH
jgi:hypothetical protein